MKNIFILATKFKKKLASNVDPTNETMEEKLPSEEPSDFFDKSQRGEITTVPSSTSAIGYSWYYTPSISEKRQAIKMAEILDEFLMEAMGPNSGVDLEGDKVYLSDLAHQLLWALRKKWGNDIK